MTPRIALYRVRRGHWRLTLSDGPPRWVEHYRWLHCGGGPVLEITGAAAERLDVLDLGLDPCLVAPVGGAFRRLRTPRFVLRLAALDRVRVQDTDTGVEVRSWANSRDGETWERVHAEAVRTVEGMNRRHERRTT